MLDLDPIRVLDVQMPLDFRLPFTFMKPFISSEVTLLLHDVKAYYIKSSLITKLAFIISFSSSSSYYYYYYHIKILQFKLSEPVFLSKTGKYLQIKVMKTKLKQSD